MRKYYDISLRWLHKKKYQIKINFGGPLELT